MPLHARENHIGFEHAQKRFVSIRIFGTPRTLVLRGIRAAAISFLCYCIRDLNW